MVVSARKTMVDETIGIHGTMPARGHTHAVLHGRTMLRLANTLCQVETTSGTRYRIVRHHRRTAHKGLGVLGRKARLYGARIARDKNAQTAYSVTSVLSEYVLYQLVAFSEHTMVVRTQLGRLDERLRLRRRPDVRRTVRVRVLQVARLVALALCTSTQP